MKFHSIVLILATAISSLAQDIDSLPQCAQDCITNAFQNSRYESAPPSFICSDDEYAMSFDKCTLQTCDAAERSATITGILGLCKGSSSTERQLVQSLTNALGASNQTSSAGSTAAPSTASDSTTSSTTGTAAISAQSSFTTTGTVTASTSNPTPFTGGADSLRLGQWMGVMILGALFFL